MTANTLTCNTCKHWDKPKRARPKEGGVCENSKLREWNDEGGYELDVLVYSYNEGGHFWTGPDFGCVHHEPKQT